MSKKILSINANRAMNYLLQTLLSKEYQFTGVSDVFYGLHFLRRNTGINTLIVDLDFQPQQGWDLIEHVKSSLLYNSTITIIVLATENTETLRQRCYEYEVDEIFFKPFNPVDLIAAIRSTVPITVIN